MARADAARSKITAMGGSAINDYGYFAVPLFFPRFLGFVPHFQRSRLGGASFTLGVALG